MMRETAGGAKLTTKHMTATTGGDGEDVNLPFFCAWEGYGLSQPGSGIYSYARELYRQLAGLGVRPLVVGARQAAAPEFARDFLAWQPSCSQVARRLKLVAPHLSQQSLERAAREGALLHPGLAQARVGILHGLANTNIAFYRRRPALTEDAALRGRRSLPWRSVVTIHDVIPLLPGSGVSASYRAQFAFALPRVVAAADRIVCVSQWTADSLCRFEPSAAGKLVVIPNGVPALQEEEELGRREAEGGPLRLLAVARNEPYKRLGFLIAALAGLEPTAAQLTVVSDAAGLRYWYKAAANVLARGQLRLKSGLSREALADEYQQADLYLQPSLYEGYGLPAVEALGHGVPVIYQSGTAADEVLGPGVGLAMPATASLADWRDAILSWQSRKYSPDFTLALQAYARHAPTWPGAALALKSVYNSLT